MNVRIHKACLLGETKNRVIIRITEKNYDMLKDWVNEIINKAHASVYKKRLSIADNIYLGAWPCGTFPLEGYDPQWNEVDIQYDKKQKVKK